MEGRNVQSASSAEKKLRSKRGYLR